jgi:hypothetical protein
MVDLLGTLREVIVVYDRGGFTSHDDEQLRRQLSCWVNDGIRAVKIEIGTHPECDLGRIRAAREVIGDAQLFVDANGAYGREQALRRAGSSPTTALAGSRRPYVPEDLAARRNRNCTRLTFGEEHARL